MKKNYKVSIAEGSDERLKGILGYEKEHIIELDGSSFKFFYNKNMDERVASKNNLLGNLKERILAKKDFSMHNSGGSSGAVAAYMPHSLCMYSLMLKEIMQEFVPDQNYSFTYILRNPSEKADDPANTFWDTDFVVKMADDLDNDFNLEVEDVGFFPITIEEVSDLEKITESPVKQGQETAAGTD